MAHRFYIDTLAWKKRHMSSGSDAFAGESAASDPGSLQGSQLDETVSHEGTTSLSLQESPDQVPDLSLVRQRYERGEITPEEMRAALQSIRDHLRRERERKAAFAERERRGEVTQAERQKEYGWTDEEMQAIRKKIRMETEIRYHNIECCANRSVLYRDSRGH